MHDFRHGQRVAAAFENAVAVRPVAPGAGLLQLRSKFREKRLDVQYALLPPLLRLAREPMIETVVGRGGKDAMVAFGPARQETGISEPQAVPAVGIALDQDEAGGRRIIVARQIDAGGGSVPVGDQPCNEIMEQIVEGNLARGKFVEMRLRAGHQPLRIAAGLEMIARVDAGDAVEDPSGRDVLAAARITEAILIDRTAALACRSQKLHPRASPFAEQDSSLIWLRLARQVGGHPLTLRGSVFCGDFPEEGLAA